MGDAGNGLSERRHLLGLQELRGKVSRVVVQLLALADVPYQGVDVQPTQVGGGIRTRRQFDPDGGPIRTPQPQQVVGHRSLGRQAIEQCRAGLRIDEPIGIERTDGFVSRVARVTEDEFQMGV